MDHKMMSSSDLIDAKLEQHQLCTASKHCPACGHHFQYNMDEWVGLPAGVKFDPTDQELIQHLEAKVVMEGNHHHHTNNNNNNKHTMMMMTKSHPLIDEFIPTIEGEDGICYTHPEKLPGVSRDGLSRHFFHRPSKAYTTGTRKRRKIQNNNPNNSNLESSSSEGGGGGEGEGEGEGETRWHKTGKTRAVMVKGKQKGCKKILVLYTNFGKNRKPQKTNWVMHQYHLGAHEEEKEGQLVVSKIFYQTHPRQCTSIISNTNTNTTMSLSTTTCSDTSSTGEPSTTLVQHEIHDPNITNYNVTTTSCTTLTPTSSSSSSFSTYAHHHAFHNNLQHLKSHHFSFIPFNKPLHQVGILGEGWRGREVVEASGSCEEVHDHQQQDHIANTTSFHMMSMTRPTSSHLISTMTPPPNHTSIILDDVSRLMLQNDPHFQESSITTPQEAEWLKYSSYWPDPDNPSHHHG